MTPAAIPHGALFLLILLAGCAAPYSETPLATNFPTSRQPKLQAADHWATIARDVARQLAAGLNDSRPVHIDEASSRSEFERAFARQLASALMEQGHAVSRSPHDALILAFDTQVVRFSPDRLQSRDHGGLTLLASGLWALAAVDATAAGAATAGVAGYDGYRAASSEFARGDTPATEILITVHVSDGARYLAHRSLVYYAADGDRALYDPGSGGHPIRMQGGL
ncbi:hypothetical protein [Methyloversatilis thermotolerans]|uniref:hypothetical protein n=1 Tax=Methyloversatilis thermotolerans TaxID=1346290 RepID=UPI0003725526|nr:hypothetical protein [Methyloversatilis thermotolerans]